MSAEDPGWPLPKTAATGPPMITGRTLIINEPNLADELRTTGGLGISSCVVDDLVFTIGTANVDIKETVDGRNLTDYAAVHVANYPRPTASVITALLDYLRRHNVKAINMDGIGGTDTATAEHAFGFSRLLRTTDGIYRPRPLAR